MAEFDKEIKQAIKIGKEWAAKSESYEAKFIAIKKDSLSLEKAALKKLQDGVKSGDHLSPKPKISYKDEIQQIKKKLEGYFNDGEKLYDEHGNWALSEPRKSMAPIDAKLKLGGSNSEAYKAVAAGIKNQLVDVAAAIKSTQQVWDKDVKFALETQQSRVEALEKIILQDQNSSSAFIDQIRKESKAFVDLCDKVWLSISGKLPSHAADLPAAQQGKLADKAPNSLRQQFSIYESRVVEIPKLLAMIEKNHKRVLKSVPASFIKGFMTMQEKKLMDDKEKDIKLKLNQALKLYQKLVSTYQDKNLV